MTEPAVPIDRRAPAVAMAHAERVTRFASDGDEVGVIGMAWLLVSERLGLPDGAAPLMVVDGAPRRLPTGPHGDTLLCRELAALVAAELRGGVDGGNGAARLATTVDGGWRRIEVTTDGAVHPATRDAAAAVTAAVLELVDPGLTVGAMRDAIDELARPTSRRTGEPVRDRVVGGPERFAELAASRPSDPAITDRHGVVSYGELAAQVGGLAQQLHLSGVGPGSIVATYLDKGPAAIAAALAAWAVGAAYVHIDPLEPAGRVAQMIAIAKAECVVTQAAYAPAVGKAGGRVVLVEERGESPYQIAERMGGAELAYLVFTSGSTGWPKAVEIDHLALRTYISGFLMRLGPLRPRSYASMTTLASDLGNTCIYAALATGARLDLYDRDEVLDRTALARRLERTGVDCIKYTPSQLAVLAHGAIEDVLPREALVMGGERLPAALVAKALAARPDLRIFNHYGPSETTIGVMMYGPVDADHVRSRNNVPIGRPLSGVTADVVDPAGRPVLGSARGVLRIAGASVARGYRGADTAEERAFGRCSNGTRTYRTGDIVECDEHGDFIFAGREDDQVKVRGHRVEPAEVEKQVALLEGVRRVAVQAEAGEHGAELIAFVVLDDGVEVRDVTRALGGRVPPQMVPTQIRAVVDIPLGLNGKVDVEALFAIALATGHAAAANPAANDVEREIAELWRRVLGRDDIGHDDKFFEVGGDSFKTLTVFAQLSTRHPDLMIADLFNHPTIATLAAAIRDDPGETAAPTYVDL